MRLPTLTTLLTTLLLVLLLPSVIALDITPTTTSSQHNSIATFNFTITGNESTISQVTLSPFIAANGDNFTVTPTINFPAPNGSAVQGSISFNIENPSQPQYNATLNVSADNTTSLFTLTLNILQNKDFSLQATDGEAALHKTTNNVVSHEKVKLTIINTGSQPLEQVRIDNVELNNGQQKINITPSEDNFSLNPGENKTVSFDATLAGISRGIYSGVAKVIADGFEKQATLRLTVRDATISLEVLNTVLPSSERNVTINHTLQLHNNGDFDLTGVSIDLPQGVTLLSATPTAILKGETVNVSIQAVIPLDQDSGEKRLADIQISSNEGTTTATLYSNAVSKLKVNNIKLKLLDYVASTVSQDGGEFGKEANPGDTFSITVDVENDFSDSDDVDYAIEDIEINVVFEEAGEDGDDIEGDSDRFDLSAQEKKTVPIDMDEDRIDWHVREGTHLITVTVQGEDENSAIHTTTFTAKVVVKRDPNEDIRITAYDVSPTTLTCGEDLTIEVEGRNIGSRSDKNVRLVVSNLNLGIAEDLKFEMGDYASEECDAIDNPDEGCREFLFRKTFTIPTDIASKTYPILIKTYHDHSVESDQKTVPINIQCDEVTDETSQSTNEDSNENSKTQNTATANQETSNNGGAQETLFNKEQGSTDNSVAVQNTFAPKKISFEVLPPSEPTQIIKKQSLEESDLYLPVLILLTLIVVGGIISATTALRK